MEHQPLCSSPQSEELGWDDALDATSGNSLLIKGLTNFTVVEMVRDRFGGSDKMAACPVAALTLRVTDEEGNVALVSDRLFLNRKMLYKITSFGRSTGLIPAEVQDGDVFKMPWDKVVGATGRCEIGHREWVGDDGEKRTYNQVKRYI
jgi:hypothetical protein